jgi:hypothetical protein
MFRTIKNTKWLAVTSLALGVIVASSLSTSEAEAGNRKGRKWKQHECTQSCEKEHRTSCRPHSVYYGKPVRVETPWYRGARRVVIEGDPFYYNAGLGVYLGGVALHLNLTNAAPDGYVYYDPVCDERFFSVRAYKRHLKSHRHAGGLTLVRVCEMDCDGRCGHDHDRYDDDGGRYRDVAWSRDRDRDDD